MVIDHKLHDTLRRGANRIDQWLAKEAPRTIPDMRQLATRSAERTCFHIGYLMALRHVIQAVDRAERQEHRA